MTSMIRILRRLLATAPGYAVAVFLSLTLVVLVNSVALPALWTVYAKPLPYQDDGALVQLRIDLRDIDFQVGLSPSLAQTLRANKQTFSGVIGSQQRGPAQLDDQAQTWELQRVSADFGTVLGVAPALGVDLTRAREVDAVLLSDAVWRERFDADPGVLGRPLRIGRTLYTICGVMPPGFGWPDREAQAWTSYTPTAVEVEQDLGGGFGQFHVVGRLAPGATLAAAQVALQQALAASPSSFLNTPSERVQAQARPWRASFTDAHGDALWLLQGAAGLLLLVAAANLGNLVLDRLWARRRSLATQRALGASPAQLLSQVAGELLMPAAIGTLLGWWLAPLGVELLQQRGLLPDALPLKVGGDGSMLLAALLSAAIVCALTLTAVAVVLPRLLHSPSGSARGASQRLGRTQRIASVLQIALTTVLVGGAALLLKSAQVLHAEPTGFAADGVLLTQVDLTDAQSAGVAVAPAIETLTRDVAALPGVRQVALADMPPFGAAEFVGVVATGANAPEEVRVPGVGPGYFATLGTPLLAGREFTADDRQAVIVDAAFAARWGQPASALGQTVTMDPGGESPRQATVVGVVASVRQQALDESLRRPAVYSPAAAGASVQFLVTRTDGDAAALALSVRLLLARTLPDARLMVNQPLAAAVARSLATRKALLECVTVFGIATLLLASLGLYALLGALVQRRRAELGIRMALGETATRIQHRVLRGGSGLLLAGILLGSVAGMLLASRLADLLYRTGSADPLAWTSAALLVLVIGLAACWQPARRATRVPLKETLAAMTG